MHRPLCILYAYTYIRIHKLQLLTGDHEWAGGIVGLEKNHEVVKDLTDMCDYLVKVLNTMNDSPYKRHVMERTNYKLSVSTCARVRVCYVCLLSQHPSCRED